MTEVFLNNKFIGMVERPTDFVKQFITERRKNLISRNANITYDTLADEVHIDSTKGRARRPIIVVKDGKSLVTESILRQLEKKELSWTDLVDQGIIEYIDSLEEENCYCAMMDEDITPEHTHVEINPIVMLGLCGSLVPYANHSPGARVSIGTKNQKQALGFYAANFPVRIDTDVNILHYAQIPIVRTIMDEIYGEAIHPAGQNMIVAVMSYSGYNMDDAIIVNKSSIERGLGRSSYFKPEITEELRYAGGLIDEIAIPEKDVKGYKSDHDYRFLEDDGIISAESKVKEGDVVIGETSPLRFLSSMDEYNLTSNIRRESSVSIKHGEQGIVDFILITENEEGNKLVKVRMRDQRVPEVGDKFTSRYGQKGVVGVIRSQADMPFSTSGMIPDLIFSPHGMPKRMTISHLIELLAGKVGALGGRRIDGTTFSSEKEGDLRLELAALGFRENGVETLYNGETGEQILAKIYIGNMFYLKLKHMVANKIHSRARGPIQLLTRQPTEGRAKEGGLRLGEMK